MAAIAPSPSMTLRRRRSRADGTDAQVMLQGRVRPEVRELAAERAAAAGVSLAVYLEQLVLHEPVDAHGRPHWAEEYLAAGAGTQEALIADA